jgi:hypothetical protein
VASASPKTDIGDPRLGENSMPDVLIEVRGDWLKARKGEFIEAIEDSIITALKAPKHDTILRLIEHAPECFSFRAGRMNGSRTSR